MRAIVLAGVMLACATHAVRAERWFDPRCKVLPWRPTGQFVLLPDNKVLSIGDNVATVSPDQGKTWSVLAPMTDGRKPGIPQGGGAFIVRTRDGAIVVVYMDLSTFHIEWDSIHGGPKGEYDLDVWSVRSLDDGKTWIDRHKIFDGYCGAIIHVLETRDGHIVVPISRLATNPGHHTTCTFVSADRGRTWRRSNIIDVGGQGDHDGCCEPTVVELGNGRLMMLMRTSLDQFWRAYSEDHGLTWLTVEPSGIDASSAPGHLLRLASGRIVLFWNRLAPEDGGPYLIRRQPFTHRPASWHRRELSMAFSEDDGKSWSKPTVIGRDDNASGLSYTYPLEHKPGELWLGIYNADPRAVISLREEDFVESKGGAVRAASVGAPAR